MRFSDLHTPFLRFNRRISLAVFGEQLSSGVIGPSFPAVFTACRFRPCSPAVGSVRVLRPSVPAVFFVRWLRLVTLFLSSLSPSSARWSDCSLRPLFPPASCPSYSLSFGPVLSALCTENETAAGSLPAAVYRNMILLRIFSCCNRRGCSRHRLRGCRRIRRRYPRFWGGLRLR